MTYRFLRDELITLSPALTAAFLIAVIGAVIPRDLLLFVSLFAAMSVTAALATFLPPVRAARARLVRARNISDQEG